MKLPLSVVLLQHTRELGRPTATGPLLAHHSLEPHLRVQAWTWAGRGDNGRIECQLDALTNPVLLWTGDGAGGNDAAGAGAAAAGTAAAAACTAAAAAVDDGPHDYIPHDYIVLDGTWQEAKSIYRKGPDCLRACPRAALVGGPSRYVLRGDYGWRARFGAEAGAGAAEPLCTAEVVASLMEQRNRDAAGGAALRALLGDFQAG
jgi:DTW domain-containing protein YfiP